MYTCKFRKPIIIENKKKNTNKKYIITNYNDLHYSNSKYYLLTMIPKVYKIIKKSLKYTFCSTKYNAFRRIGDQDMFKMDLLKSSLETILMLLKVFPCSLNLVTSKKCFEFSKWHVLHHR